MTYYSIKGETMAQIADAIRERNGSQEQYTPEEMATAIENMEGSLELSIAYGQTEPTDSGVLWVKADRPDGVTLTVREFRPEKAVEADIQSLPFPSSHMGTAMVWDKIYLFGGHAHYGGNTEGYTTDKIYVFDTENHSIETLNTYLPLPESSVAAATIGEKIYLFGGWNGVQMDGICVFDPAECSLRMLNTRLPIAASRIAAVPVGKNIFLFGGQYEEKSYGDWIWVYDSEADSIVSLSVKLPVGVQNVAAAAVGTKIYLCGGRCGKGLNLDAIYVFDTESYTLSKKHTTIPLTAGTSYSAIAAIGAKLYLFGGRTMEDIITDAIAVYDVERDEINTLSAKLPIAAESMSVAAKGENIYVFGGCVDTSTYFSGIHCFADYYVLAENQLLVEITQMQNFAKLADDKRILLEAGVGNVYRGNAKGLGEQVPAAVWQDGQWVEI